MLKVGTLGLLAAGLGMADYRNILEVRSQRILAAIGSTSDREKATPFLEDIMRYIVAAFEGEATFQEGVQSFKPLVQILNGPLSYEIATELDNRLRLLAEYQLPVFERIFGFLTSGLNTLTSATLRRHYVSFIKLVNENPTQGVVTLSRQLKVSPRTVRKNQQNLSNQYGLRIAAILDVPRFGLSHFGVHFRARGIDHAYDFEKWIRNPANALELSPFLLGYGINPNHFDGYCSFFVPDRIHSLKRMERKLKWLEQEFFESMTLLKIKGTFSNVNFDSYDYVSQSWSIFADLSTEGTLSFIKEHGPQFSLPRGVYYSTQISRFHEVDWLLALMYCAGFLQKAERVTTLARYGFPLAEKTVWAHERRLIRSRTLLPTIMFSNLAFEDIICLIIQCEEQLVANLVQVVIQYAYSRIHPTNEGVIFFIGVPTGGSSLLNHLTRTLVQEAGIHQFTVLRLKQDLPQMPSLKTYALWDNESQQWKSE
ncbi:MAG: hypothetical protein ACFFDU_08240 [Candidatus Thorarchaeota archaeon]